MNAPSPEALSILDILSPDSIIAPFEVATKQEAIDGLVDRLAENGAIADPAAMKHVVWERENQRSTGIGNGIAIPHGKSTDLRRLVLAIGVPARPVEFDSIDGKPVRLLALLLSPSERIAEHIQALGRISRLMENEAFREAACSCEEPNELFEHIRSREQD